MPVGASRSRAIMMISSLLSKTFSISSLFILIVQFSTKILAAEVANNERDIWSEVPFVNKYSYVSPVGLKSLFALEVTLYNSLSQYAVLKPSRIPHQLQLYLADYEESTLKALSATGKEGKGSIENLSWNPVLAFRTVWRFVKYLRRWADPGKSMTKSQAWKFKDISLLLAQHYNTSHGPTSSDLEDAKMAFIKLADTFTMDIQRFAEGNISGKDVGVGLTAAQCIEIAWFAKKHELHVSSVEFTEAALEKVEQKGDASVQLSKAREHVQAAYNGHDEAFDDVSEWDNDFFTKKLKEVGARTERTRRRDAVPSRHERKIYDEGLNEKHRFQTVCKGTYRQAASETSKLFCWYEHQVDPSFKIGPLKAEFVAPQIVKFHQLITESAISQLKSNVSTFREFRIARGDTDKTVKDFTIRLGAFSGLHPGRYSTASLIASLAGRATGLQYKERNFESLHVAVYTPGAYFSCHPDHARSNGKIYRFRIATFMVYLSEVEEGGGTGFCKHGVVVQPEVGSALLWFNMLSSGKRDLMSDHCSCPVVFGEKWVSTAWIFMGLQPHLQCSPDQSKKLEYLVNKKSVTF